MKTTSTRIFETQDGSHSIFSEIHGVSYHSKYGAIQETQHVFIEAGLQEKAKTQKTIAILGIGFGTGLNVLMTYLEAQKQNLTIDYIGVEAFPLDQETVEQLNYAAVHNHMLWILPGYSPIVSVVLQVTKTDAVRFQSKNSGIHFPFNPMCHI